MATHSSVLAWRIPGTGEPGGLPSMASHRVGHDWSDLAAVTAISCYNGVLQLGFCQLQHILGTLFAVSLLSCVQLFVTPRTAVHQTSLCASLSPKVCKHLQEMGLCYSFLKQHEFTCVDAVKSIFRPKFFLHFQPVGIGSSRFGEKVTRGLDGLPCWCWDLVHHLPLTCLKADEGEEVKWRWKGGQQWKGKVGGGSEKLGLQLELQLAAQRNLRHFDNLKYFMMKRWKKPGTFLCTFLYSLFPHFSFFISVQSLSRVSLWPQFLMIV